MLPNDEFSSAISTISKPNVLKLYKRKELSDRELGNNVVNLLETCCNDIIDIKQ